MSNGAVFMAVVCASFPALVLVAGVVKLWELRVAGRWPATTGTVTASRVESRRNAPGDLAYNFNDTEMTNEPFVEYKYEVGGKTYRCSRLSIAEKTPGSERERILARYPVGAAVTVYYDPKDPSRALLERTLPFVPMLVGGWSVMLLFLGGPLLAAFLYVNALYWLEGHVENRAAAKVVALLAGFGVAVTLFALVFHAAVRRAAKWPTVAGVVTASGVEAHRVTGEYGAAQVRYRSAVVYAYAVNGREYAGDRLTVGVTVTASFPGYAAWAAARYPVGSEVAVHYDPLDPGASVLRPRSPLHHLLWVIAATLFALAWGIATASV